MTCSEFYNRIAQSTAHRPSREENSVYVLEHPETFTYLLTIAFDVSDKNHHKACWILELVLEQQLDLLDSHLDKFCKIVAKYTHDGAVRSISKICWFLMQKQTKEVHKNNDFLTKPEVKNIIEACLDWMIGETKVASKVYAMRALFEFGKLNPAIYTELRDIIEKDFSLHSYAYQAAAKDILKRLR